MAPRYGNYRRKPKRKYKRYYKRRQMVQRPIKQNIHFFKRTHSEEHDIKPSNGILFVANTMAITGAFQLSYLPNYSDFTNLFDEYRIVGISIKWIFTANNANYISQNTNNIDAVCGLPLLHYCIDTNSASPAATINAMREYNTYKVRRLDKPCKVYIRPSVASAVYDSAATWGYTSTRKPWIDTSTPTVDYYGIKWAIDPVYTAYAYEIGAVEIIYTYYVQCKVVH